MRLNNTIMKLRIRKVRHGFTLVELIVVISIVAVLMALVLSGVNGTREAARRVHCSNSLRQLGLGLHSFHTVHDKFPFGNAGQQANFRSWITEILPQIEQTAIAETMNASIASANAPIVASTNTSISILRCPSSIIDFDGDTDYAGILGSTLASAASVSSVGINNGVLIQQTVLRRRPISITEIVDGSSYTVCISEVVDRLEEEHGIWSDGRSCISHDNGPINIVNSDEIFSFHPAGAHIVLCDGAVRFINESIEPKLIGALCSRNGNENSNLAWEH